MNVLVCRAPELIEDNELWELAVHMPEKRFRRYSRTRHAPSARSLVLNYWTAIIAIGRFADVDDPQSHWVTGERGKPLLDMAGVHMSLSRRGAVQACVVSEHAVGIDVEEISDRVVQAVPVVCNDRELNRMYQAENARYEATLLWTMKESLLKHAGTGFDEDVKSVDVTNTGPGLRFDSWEVDSHLLTVCSDDRAPWDSSPEILDSTNVYHTARGLWNPALASDRLSRELSQRPLNVRQHR